MKTMDMSTCQKKRKLTQPNRSSTGLLMAVFIFFAASAGVLNALEITGTAPQFSGSATSLNTDLSNEFHSLVGDINDKIKNIDSNPEKMIKAFGNASVFASEGATLRGYAGYNLFAFAIGPMVGAQLPYSVFDIIADPSGIVDKTMDKLEAEKDLIAGINAQGINVQVGINTSFLLDGLYLGLKAGYFPGESFLPEGFRFNTFSIGGTASYQFLPKLNLLGGLLVWRGLTFSSGIIYQSTEMGLEVPLDDQTYSGGANTFDLTISPKMKLDINVKTVTIPLEAVTSVRLLWFLNLSAGIGADLGFGSSEVTLGADADIKAKGKGTYAGAVESTPGSLSLKGGGSSAPSFFNPKLMLGLGLSLGPVFIDVPVTFYLENGYSVGLSVGFSL